MRLPSNITPRIRPVPANKSAILSALDVGTSKVVCLIARLDPLEGSDVLSGRTHRMRVLGIGHQKSRGLKGGTVIDLGEAEKSIRLAVDAAERMAGVQVASAAAPVIVVPIRFEATTLLSPRIRTPAPPLPLIRLPPGVIVAW